MKTGVKTGVKRGTRSARAVTALVAALVVGAAPSLAPRAATGQSPRVTAAATTKKKRTSPKKRHPAPKRAKVGERVPVEITYYCLQGTTRTDRPTRDGIVAADPRVFPLRRHVELFSRRGDSLGRFLVDDTGALVRGHVIDVWVPSCDDARRRGRRRGTAVLLKRGVATEGLAVKPVTAGEH